jgi:hypothetical protein
MILLLVLIYLVKLDSESFLQEKNFWQVLAEVGHKKERVNGYEMDVPVFSTHLKSWNGKKIMLKGFVIPAGEVGDESKFMFSSLPYSTCYFCGGAGPETILEVESGEKVKFTTQAVWMEGILALNDKDPDHHMFILKSATIIEP